jgi:uncharacterized membrane protein
MRSHGMSLSKVGALLGGVVGLGTIAGVMLGAVVGGHELTPAEQVDYFAHLAWLNPSAGWLAFNQNGIAGMLAAILRDAGVQTLFDNDVPLIAAV